MEQVWATHHFRTEEIRILEHRYRCLDTREVFYTPDLDRLNLAQIQNQYRAMHQIPFPVEIRRIREQYGVSAARMSEILGLGINSYRQYELGEIPTLANAKLIRLAANPDRFSEFVHDKHGTFSPRQMDKILQRVRTLHASQRLSPIMDYLWNYHLEANEYTGFVKPTLEKVAQFVLFFVSQCQPLKTRLNKLLFYADFHHFKQTGSSISGCSYRAIPYGPVPSHFHELFGMLENQGVLRIEEELFPSGHVGERFLQNLDTDLTLFSESELQTMNKVASGFQSLRTKELIHMSHMEDAWKFNHKSRDLISYQQYGFRLKAL